MALTWPDRAPGVAKRLDWTSLRTLEFEPVDHVRFPAVSLAHQVIRQGGTAGATLNAANEAAVHAFLEGRISFGRIGELVQQAMSALPAAPLRSLQDAASADAAARRFVESRVGPSLVRS